LEQAALDPVGQITRHSAAAMRINKHLLRDSRETARAKALSRAGEIYVEALMQTKDALEGLQAFLEKRRPTWSHE
jgi:enoyl-CoA hydratase/carnithine racemase